MAESILLMLSLIFTIGFIFVRIMVLYDQNPDSELLINALNLCCSNEDTDEG
jgi:hypothetical protein